MGDSQQQNAIGDHWVKSLTTGGNIRAVAIECTQLAREITQRHGLKGIHARAMAEALVGGLTLASNLKKGHVVNLNIKPEEGPVKQVFSEITFDGKVRGYLIKAESSLELTEENEKGIFGTKGFINVLRAKKGSHELPFTGTVQILTGHLAKDLTFYWLQSEQVPSAVGIQVYLDKQHQEVQCASGFLVQAMPGASDEELSLLESALTQIPQYQDGHKGKVDSPTQVLSKLFQDLPLTIIDKMELRFKCQCSMERVWQTLMILPVEDLKALALQDETTVGCDFCNEVFNVSPEQIQEVIQKKKTASA